MVLYFKNGVMAMVVQIYISTSNVLYIYSYVSAYKIKLEIINIFKE